jgi:hypothetical protein
MREETRKASFGCADKPAEKLRWEETTAFHSLLRIWCASRCVQQATLAGSAEA